MQNIPFLISLIVISIILFQSIIIAPAVNKLLSFKEASVLLRNLWPKFFLLISILSLISIINIIFLDLNQNKTLIFTIASFTLMLFCFLITPKINKAKDSGNKKLWNILHLSTVIITIVTLLLNFIVVVNYN